MKIDEAMKIVLELAQQNIIDEHDHPEEHKRQTEACERVAAFIYFSAKED
ncbi:MAG: hypothetical protein JWP25_344 [Bradyrhizobium sp.]|nr:hypothetical protein [Bradyrhizobium sp.]